MNQTLLLRLDLIYLSFWSDSTLDKYCCKEIIPKNNLYKDSMKTSKTRDKSLD